MINSKVVKISVVIILLGIIAFFLLPKVLKSDLPKADTNNKESEQTQVSEKDKPQIVSTKPDSLEGTIISANETIEITFNRPLENVGEFKLRIEPETKLKVELSADRKTAKIAPETAYELGVGYTLFIGTESKFDGVGRWGEEKVFHFQTIRYRGV